MKDNWISPAKSCFPALYLADKILAIFRAYKKLLMEPSGSYKETVYGAELKRPIDAMHMCNTMLLDRAVVGHWYPDRRASTRDFVPTKYMLLLRGDVPCVWIAGEIAEWPPCPQTASLVTSWQGKDGIYHAQPWTPPYDYPADELTEALLWFANLFEYDDIDYPLIIEDEELASHYTTRGGHQDAVARAVGK